MRSKASGKMSTKLKAALKTLGFENVKSIPKMKEIRKQYLDLSKKLHPDKPGGSKVEFQEVLEAYTLAGEAAEQVLVDETDIEEVVARKVFEQFKSNSVTENSTTFTIHFESTLASVWSDVLTHHFGIPDDKDIHGKKFTFNDSCLSNSSSIFITQYKTNKLLVQSKKQALNIHFIDQHLEGLFMDVLNRKNTLLALKSIGKRVKESPLIRNLRSKSLRLTCKDCEHIAPSVASMKEHRKSHYLTYKSSKVKQLATSSVNAEKVEAITDFIDRLDEVSPPSKVKSHYCMLCGFGSSLQEELDQHIKHSHELPCDSCDTVFFDPYDLVKHELTHTVDSTTSQYQHCSTGQNKCNECGEIFGNSEMLEVHLDAIHPNKIDIGDSRNLVFIRIAEEFLDTILSHPTVPDAILSDDLASHYSEKTKVKDNDITSKAAKLALTGIVDHIHTAGCHCVACDLEYNDVEFSEIHIDTPHKKFRNLSASEKIIYCNHCSFSATTESAFNLHHQSHTTPVIPGPFPCSFCGVAFGHNSDLMLHVDRVHSENSKSFADKQDDPTHTSMISMILEQNLELTRKVTLLTDIVNKLENAQNNLTRAFAPVIDGTTNILTSQEDIIKHINNLTHTIKSNQTTAINSPYHVNHVPPNDLGHVQNPPKDNYCNPHPRPHHSVPQARQEQSAQHLPSVSLPFHHQTPARNIDCEGNQKTEKIKTHMRKHKVSQHTALSIHPKIPCNKCDFRAHNDYQMKRHLQVRHYDDERMLYIGDSVSLNANFALLERELCKSVTALEADGIDNNTSSGPVKCFLDTIDHELENNSYKTLVLAAGAAEISKIRSLESCDPAKLREETIEVAQKIFCLAETALEEHSELEKVVVVKNTPRFDSKTTDSAQLKPKLALLADSVLFGLWCESKYKDQIILGGHDISEWSRYDIHQAYGFPHVSGYDGVHLYGRFGRTILTRSLITMLRNSLIAKNVSVTDSHYDPYLILRDRIHSSRDKLKSQHLLTDLESRISKVTPPNCLKSNRTSVIKSLPSVSQSCYNIPISNSFDVLGN